MKQTISFTFSSDQRFDRKVAVVAVWFEDSTSIEPFSFTISTQTLRKRDVVINQIYESFDALKKSGLLFIAYIQAIFGYLMCYSIYIPMHLLLLLVHTSPPSSIFPCTYSYSLFIPHLLHLYSHALTLTPCSYLTSFIYIPMHLLLLLVHTSPPSSIFPCTYSYSLFIPHLLHLYSHALTLTPCSYLTSFIYIPMHLLLLLVHTSPPSSIFPCTYSYSLFIPHLLHLYSHALTLTPCSYLTSFIYIPMHLLLLLVHTSPPSSIFPCTYSYSLFIPHLLHLYSHALTLTPCSYLTSFIYIPMHLLLLLVHTSPPSSIFPCTYSYSLFIPHLLHLYSHALTLTPCSYLTSFIYIPMHLLLLLVHTSPPSSIFPCTYSYSLFIPHLLHLYSHALTLTPCSYLTSFIYIPMHLLLLLVHTSPPSSIFPCTYSYSLFIPHLLHLYSHALTLTPCSYLTSFIYIPMHLLLLLHFILLITLLQYISTHFLFQRHTHCLMNVEIIPPKASET